MNDLSDYRHALILPSKTDISKYYLARLYNIEKDLRFVQDQAGHASPTTTAIYAKTNNKARKRQVQALDEEEF